LEELNSCEYIFSESLHGLIIADAYGIKNAWIKMGGDVGDGFKYRDYYSTTINPQAEAISVIDVSSCIVHDYKYNLKTLLNSCPFYNGKYS
jgi:pyruvyltransferase